jgi:hypothetical protein
MQDHYEDVPSSIKYPKEEIVRMLLPNIWRDVNGKIDQVENFTSSTAYALALAIYKGFTRIELAGIEMASDTEYVRQRPGVLFWIGVAVGRGIDVVLHSPLMMNDKPYGYTGEVMITRQQFEMASRKIKELTEVQKARSFEEKGRTNALLDALLTCKEPAQGQRLLQAFLLSLNNAQEASWEYGRMAGALQENERYLKQCDELIQAAGGEKSLQVMMGIYEGTKEKIEYSEPIEIEPDFVESVEA